MIIMCFYTIYYFILILTLKLGCPVMHWILVPALRSVISVTSAQQMHSWRLFIGLQLLHLHQSPTGLFFLPIVGDTDGLYATGGVFSGAKRGLV